MLEGDNGVKMSLKLMRSQWNPDGEEGHKEREKFRNFDQNEKESHIAIRRKRMSNKRIKEMMDAM